MKLSSINPDRLIKAKYNPANRTSKKALTLLKTSIKEHGILYPLLIDGKNRLIDGHRRLACAKQLKIKNVPVVITDSPLSQNESFETINATQKKISNSDMIYMYVNGGSIPKKALMAVREIESLVGKTNLKKIGNSSVSYYVLKQARKVSSYCKKNEDTEFLSSAIMWLVNNKQSYIIRRALEDGVSKSSLVSAISKNRPLKRNWK